MPCGNEVGQLTWKTRLTLLLSALAVVACGMVAMSPANASAYDRTSSLDNSDERWMIQSAIGNAKEESISCAINAGARRLATRVGLAFGAIPAGAAMVGGFLIDRIGTSPCKAAVEFVKFALAIRHGSGNGRAYRLRIYKDGLLNWRCTWKQYVNNRKGGKLREVFKVTWPAAIGCPD